MLVKREYLVRQVEFYEIDDALVAEAREAERIRWGADLIEAAYITGEVDQVICDRGTLLLEEIEYEDDDQLDTIEVPTDETLAYIERVKAWRAEHGVAEEQSDQPHEVLPVEEAGVWICDTCGDQIEHDGTMTTWDHAKPLTLELIERRRVQRAAADLQGTDWDDSVVVR